MVQKGGRFQLGPGPRCYAWVVLRYEGLPREVRQGPTPRPEKPPDGGWAQGCQVQAQRSSILACWGQRQNQGPPRFFPIRNENQEWTWWKSQTNQENYGSSSETNFLALWWEKEMGFTEVYHYWEKEEISRWCVTLLRFLVLLRCFQLRVQRDSDFSVLHWRFEKERCSSHHWIGYCEIPRRWYSRRWVVTVRSSKRWSFYSKRYYGHQVHQISTSDRPTRVRYELDP